jgi:hypothetical protein
MEIRLNLPLNKTERGGGGEERKKGEKKKKRATVTICVIT